MATDDQGRWDKKHATEEGHEDASSFLRQLFEVGAWRIQAGSALDVATGRGRNAFFLAERGFRVEAIDISEAALKEASKLAEEKGLTITFRQVDVDHVELSESTYDMILNFNFLQRSLIAKIGRASCRERV